MIESRQWSTNYFKNAKKLKQKYREATRLRDRSAQKLYKNQLVDLYVYHGEHCKISDRPDYKAAKYYLQKALRLDHSHPLANYRYAHLMYQDKEYEKSAYHFRKAIDGNKERGLNDSQTLVAQMMLVNCGIFITIDAVKEVKFMQENEYLTYDLKLIEEYSEKMLIHSEEMLAQHMYCHQTPEDIGHISYDEYLEYQELIKDNEVLLYIDDRYRIKFKNEWFNLNHNAFCVFWIVIRANHFIGIDDIATYLKNSDAELNLQHDHIRQMLSRTKRRIPIWDEIIETKKEGTRSLRRRREGITYSLLYHSNVVLP